MKEPTEEQKFELASRCRFQYTENKHCDSCGRPEGEYWIKKGIGRRLYRLELLEMMSPDNLMSFLFKYAVPILNELSYEIRMYHSPYSGRTAFIVYKANADKRPDLGGGYHDPVLALFWPIYEALEGKDA